jgi:hypothetical protein
MVTVWVLMIYMSPGGAIGAPMVIDNIASEAECGRLQQVVSMQANMLPYVSTSCIKVKKVR